MPNGFIRSILIGQLRRHYILLANGKAMLDTPGGNLLYAAAGMSLWQREELPGLVARVGEDYPRGWLEQFNSRGFDVRGVRILPEAVDLRYFCAYSDLRTRHLEDPVVHFARHQLSMPRQMLGYQNTQPALDSRTTLLPISVRQGDLPQSYLEATSAHLCPIDYLTHSNLPAVLRQANFTTITVDPSPSYMDPAFWDLMPSLVTGLTAFLPSEEEIRQLFRGRSEDLWQMAEALSAYGCEVIVIKSGLGGQFLYDGARKRRWEIPAYPSKMVDPTGAGDAFCGGFLAGFNQTYDPLEAVLYGNIAASFTIEGSDVFYALDALPGLAQARLEALRDNVRRL